ncbi:MAG: ribonuclease E/G [Rhodobacteraceae bacterium]|nr:ribonuclease E/G [Paracoccaceae bacterium]
MAKKMLIDATHAEEIRVVVADGTNVEEFDFESLNKRQLSGNIYLAKVTRVEPSLQAAFVDYGGNRHGFLAFSEIHPDYYQIPVADREALVAEERACAEALAASEKDQKPKNHRKGSKTSPEAMVPDAVTTAPASVPSGMNVVNLDEDDEDKEQVLNGEGVATVSDDDREEIHPAHHSRPRKYNIQEVVKVRQIILVQVVKEERGNKGVALTTYLSLAGRYCVLMPNTARGGGISRKISNADDRQHLKEIVTGLDVPQGAGLIVRTAGANRTKSEIKRDYEYLQRQWEEVRTLTLKSIAPAPIYEEGNLIHRSIRDLYDREISEILVEGAAGYRQAKDFMKMIMPSHSKNVKQYTDPMPIFARHKVEGYLADMFNPTVRLKSGGYIVIGVTEALVAIDVNSGRANKEVTVEKTATRTNLEAADEVARQLRLRDLAGLIVIDFIDMDDRRNNAAVEQRIKERLKADRARTQVGRISVFGLLEMSRQRLRPGMLEATTRPCPHCRGTGLARSDDSLALSIIRQLEEAAARHRSQEMLLTAPVSIVNFIMNSKREHLARIERDNDMSIRVEADSHLVVPDYKLETFRTATRRVPEAAPIISMDAALMEEIEEGATTPEAVAARPTAEDDGDTKPKRRRHRGTRGSRKRKKAPAEAKIPPETIKASPAMPVNEPALANDAPEQPKRKGWWAPTG